MDEAAGGYVSPGGLFEENFCFMLDKRALFRYNFDSTLSVKSFKSINKRERVTVTKQTFVLLIIGLYIIVMAIVGIQGARKTRRSPILWWAAAVPARGVSAFAYGTTYFSAVLFIGYAGTSGFNFGWWAVLIGIMNGLLGAFLAWKLLASRTRDVTRRLKIKTMPQMFEKRYQSKHMKNICGRAHFSLPCAVFGQCVFRPLLSVRDRARSAV